MSELPVHSNIQTKPLWPAAAIILSLVFAPAALAGIWALLSR